jgi:xanthine dehydrogenase small subunit
LIRFILNNKEISTSVPSGSLLLDFIRYTKQLKGTKIGCREGDCGACAVLIGELKDDKLRYRTYTSCLTPLGNVHGKHVVTIEGINIEGLNAVQQCMAEASATQCGFCTPGFVMSLTAFCLGGKAPTTAEAIAAIDGNICRCTGYKSIERAAAKLAEHMQQKLDESLLQFLCSSRVLPDYFLQVKERLKSLSLQLNGDLHKTSAEYFAGGGTDLYVQKPEELLSAEINFLAACNPLKAVEKKGDKCFIRPSATVSDLQESGIFRELFPRFEKQVKLVSCTPIRNMATIAGNFINASPIGDFTIFFLALDTYLLLSDGCSSKVLPLRQLYQGYKTLDKRPEEFIEKIWFKLPASGSLYNFEKVSKRTHLDIASVNSAISIRVIDGFIKEVHISAGGVGPIPEYLENTCSFLTGRILSEELIAEMLEVAHSEISPISDARGSAEYKRLLLGQLLKAHFITLFPQLDPSTILSYQ